MRKREVYIFGFRTWQDWGTMERALDRMKTRANDNLAVTSS